MPEIKPNQVVAAITTAVAAIEMTLSALATIDPLLPANAKTMCSTVKMFGNSATHLLRSFAIELTKEDLITAINATVQDVTPGSSADAALAALRVANMLNV